MKAATTELDVAKGKLLLFDPSGNRVVEVADGVRKIQVASLASGEITLLYEHDARPELHHRHHEPRQRQDAALRSAPRSGRGRRPAGEDWLALSRELELPPGVTQVRVVVRHEARGRLGAVVVLTVLDKATGETRERVEPLRLTAGAS